MKNQDKNTVEGFGDEWSRFDQSDLPEDEQNYYLMSTSQYFLGKISQKNLLVLILVVALEDGPNQVPKAKKLICIDPSSALDIAKNLSNLIIVNFKVLQSMISQ